MIEAAKKVKINVPLVVRLQGTNADEGRMLLAESGLKLEVANDLWEAAQKIVKLTGKAARKRRRRQAADRFLPLGATLPGSAEWKPSEILSGLGQFPLSFSAEPRWVLAPSGKVAPDSLAHRIGWR